MHIHARYTGPDVLVHATRLPRLALASAWSRSQTATRWRYGSQPLQRSRIPPCVVYCVPDNPARWQRCGGWSGIGRPLPGIVRKGILHGQLHSKVTGRAKRLPE